MGGPRLRRARALALALAVALGFAGIFQHGLWTPDEPREAEIGREMLVSGISPVPTLGGEPFVEKPPLHPWILSVSYRLFGVSAGAARIPSALFGIGAVLVAFELGRRCGGRLAGLASAAVLLSTAKFADISHASVNDVALTFFVGAGHLALLRARDDERLARRSAALALAGLCAGLAFLAKAWIGPILLAGPPLAASLVARERGALRRLAIPAALACGGGVLLLGLPWALALGSTAGWHLVRVCLVDNAVGRAVGGAEYAAFGHARGPLYYLLAFPASFLPWTIVLPAAVAGAPRARRLALLVAAGLLLLSIPSGKRDLYALPLFPAASAVVGTWISRPGSRFGRASLAVLVGALVLAWAGCAAALAALASDRVPAPWQGFVHGSALVAATAVLFALGAAATAFCARREPGRAAVASALGLAFLFHAAVRPIVDPIKDLRPGSLEIAAAVPEAEPLLGFALDETTRAVLPFYTRRTIRSVDRPELALAELRSGPSRHLVVTDSGEGKLGDEARRHLVRVAGVRLGATRSAAVYALEEAR
jgi:4-amino-4-deoxy-L-arabinose transferase-like glycosyltransferase